MYQAINQYVIASKLDIEEKTESGIVLTGVRESKTYLVEKTTDETKQLQGKRVIPTHAEPLSHNLFSIDYKDIIAVME